MRVKRLLVISVALVAACKSPTPAEQMDSIQSWLGTAVMVGDAWLRHATPDKYSRQTLELSQESLRQISRDLLKSPPKSSAWTLVRPIKRFLRARRIYSVYEVRWQDMDLSDPKRPVVRTAQRDLHNAR